MIVVPWLKMIILSPYQFNDESQWSTLFFGKASPKTEKTKKSLDDKFWLCSINVMNFSQVFIPYSFFLNSLIVDFNLIELLSFFFFFFPYYIVMNISKPGLDIKNKKKVCLEMDIRKLIRIEKIFHPRWGEHFRTEDLSK